MTGYIKIRKQALDKLHTKLPEKLYYHGVHHTLKALGVCEMYIKASKIDKYQAKLLRIGILFHDIGYTVTNKEHEEKSAEIASGMMSELGFSGKDIKIVTGLIKSTRVPQSPKTILEKIICDVDLDYLGRADFYPVSNMLYKELKAHSTIMNKNEWNKIQIKFLEQHRYHTDFALKKRQPEKEKRIAELKAIVKN